MVAKRTTGQGCRLYGLSLVIFLRLFGEKFSVAIVF